MDKKQYNPLKNKKMLLRTSKATCGNPVQNGGSH
jgi:hypothetical protein